MGCLSNNDGCAKGTMNRGGRPPLIDCQPCTEAELKAAKEGQGGGFKDWWSKNGTTVLSTGTAILSSIQNNKNNTSNSNYTPPSDTEDAPDGGGSVLLIVGIVVVISMVVGIGYYIFKPKK